MVLWAPDTAGPWSAQSMTHICKHGHVHKTILNSFGDWAGTRDAHDQTAVSSDENAFVASSAGGTPNHTRDVCFLSTRSRGATVLN